MHKAAHYLTMALTDQSRSHFRHLQLRILDSRHVLKLKPYLKNQKELQSQPRTQLSNNPRALLTWEQSKLAEHARHEERSLYMIVYTAYNPIYYYLGNWAARGWWGGIHLPERNGAPSLALRACGLRPQSAKNGVTLSFHRLLRYPLLYSPPPYQNSAKLRLIWALFGMGVV